MIYSIGYAALTPERLDAIASHFQAVVVDVRSIPTSRHRGFGGRQLAALLGPGRYVWKGDVLGGRPPGVLPEGLAFLRALEPDQNVLLLCMEEAPGDCHRHRAIALALLPEIDVVHICQDELVDASELQRAIEEDDEYDADLLDLTA